MRRRDFILTGGLALIAAPALAHSYTAGALRIGHPWSRPAGAGMNGVGYLSVDNTGAAADALVSVQCAAAARVTLHESRMAPGGVMSMRQLRSIPLPGRTKTILAPGGLHIMLEGLKRPLVAGERIAATLTFAKAGRVAVEFAVQAQAPGAASGGGGGGGHEGMPGM